MRRSLNLTLIVPIPMNTLIWSITKNYNTINIIEQAVHYHKGSFVASKEADIGFYIAQQCIHTPT